jgi:hypothetical protein
MDQRERERIISEYHSAVKAYSDAVGRLIGLNGATFELAFQQVEELRAGCDKWRKALDDLESSEH